MKNHRVLSKCSAVLTILLILGCAGSPSTNGANGSSDNGVVKFKMDGVDWISGPPGHPELKYEEEAITDGNTMVRVEAFAANGSHLAFTVYQAAGIGPGTYAITDPGMSGFFKDDFKEGGGYSTSGMQGNPGVITISTLTADKVSGTFNFQMRNAGDPEEIRAVTAGSFDLKFSKY